MLVKYFQKRNRKPKLIENVQDPNNVHLLVRESICAYSIIIFYY